MAGGHGTLPSDPVARALARAHGILPDQGPIGVFVHHNTLHAFQHQPFFDGIEAGAALLGARPYLPLAAFRAAWRTGRVADDDVRTEIARTLGDGARVAVAPGLSMAALWHTLMTAAATEAAADRVAEPDTASASVPGSPEADLGTDVDHGTDVAEGLDVDGGTEAAGVGGTADDVATVAATPTAGGPEVTTAA